MSVKHESIDSLILQFQTEKTTMPSMSFFGEIQLPTKHIKQAAMFTLAASILSSAALYSASSQALEIDSERSLFIRDIAILEHFTLTETLQKLINDSADLSQTPQSLLDTWPVKTGPSCDSTQTFNGFPSRCASVTGDSSSYKAIALINRFDLAPSDGANCGEYRIAFTFEHPFGLGGNNKRDFMIFESRLPNPTPQQGLEGCRPVVNFWAELSQLDNINERANRLHDFYFNGLPGFSSVINVDNYRGGENGSGQIRFNERRSLRDKNWEFFEFRTESTPGNINILRSTVKDTPSMSLLDGSAPINLIQDFEVAVIDGLSTQGEKLLARSMGTLSYNLPNRLNTGQRRNENFDEVGGGSSSAELGEQRFIKLFDPQGDFANDIQNQLNATGSQLSPTQVIARVNGLTCAGCHSQGSDLGDPIDFKSTGQNFEMLSAELEFSERVHIEAEHFNEMKGVQTESTSDIGGGLNVGWLETGDWMIFNTPLQPSGNNKYSISYRVASLNGGTLRLEQPGGAQKWATVAIPATGGWQEWSTVFQTVAIPEGQQGFSIAVAEGGWNINWIEIKAESGSRLVLKETLKNEFIPERKLLLENFLNISCSEPSCLDTDNDGINDGVDQCGNTSEDTAVDEIGCPVITGGNCDGVTTYPNWLHNDFEGGANTHIKAGELMQHKSQLYQANWYASSLPGSDGSWSALGSCD